MVTDVSWARRHWRSLQYAYGKAPFFGDYRESLAAAYEEVATLDHLSAINNHFIRLLCSILSIRTPISFSHDILPVETLDALDSSTRLAALCEALKGDCYLSGPSVRDYLRIAPFEERGIEARFAGYHGYPNYAQPHGTYDPFVTVLDLIFCTGPRAPSHLIDLKASSVAAE